MADPRPGDMDVNANDVLAFVVELGVFALLAVAGWQTDGPTLARLALAVGLPLVAAVLWGLFAAPRARVESEPLRLATKLLVLGAGVAAAFLILPAGWAVLVAIVVATNMLLIYVGPFARRRVS